jgi:hypothetical protein
MKTFVESFWDSVYIATDGGCWLWFGMKDGDGYGRVITSRQPLKRSGAHRVSYELHNGPITRGMQVLHRCDTPACVNPAHLFLGTQKDNMDDMHRKGRAVHIGAPGERNGWAKLTEDDIRFIRTVSRKEYTDRELGALLHVARSTVQGIRSGTWWKHVTV